MAYVDGFVLAAPKDVMSNMPFDGKRMIYGGFETFLELLKGASDALPSCRR